MRVRCSAIDEYDVEREVIEGERIDPSSETCDLDSIFTVRCDDGAVVEVHGWLVDVVVVQRKNAYLM